MAVTVFPKPSGWAAGATDIAFDITTTDWTAVTGGYQAEVTNQLITASSIELVTYTESIEQLNGNISKTKDAANHKMIFTVSALPSGTISGNICTIGSLSTSVSSGEKGTANGVATLDGNGLVPSNQLPSYVDDVEEYSSMSAFPATGEIGKIYVATDTNKSYRWSGSTYVELSSYAMATTTAAGLMSATDKTKLDGIATGATANVVSNSLSDSSTTNALSAAKGKELSEQIAKQPITVTASTGMTVSNNHSYKQGNVVCLNFQVSGTISSGTYIATIPQDIAIENYVFAVDYNNDKFVPIFMYGTGNLKSFGSASSIKINATYIV